MSDQNHFAEEILWAYSEDELASEERDLIADHLSHCMECQATLDSIVKTRCLLRNLPRAEAPQDFSKHVQTRLRRRSRGRFFSIHTDTMTRTTYLVAATILTILVMLYLFSRVPQEIRDERTGLTGQQLWEQKNSNTQRN